MDTTSSLTNHFLIATPALADPNFRRTVTYICEHTENGAMGLVINRPLDLTLGEVLGHLDVPTPNPQIAGRTVFLGGPVETGRGFVLHSLDQVWEGMQQISPALAVTTTKDVLEAIADGQGPRQSLVALGYAGWGAGQLEAELAENAWLCGPADEKIIFETPCGQRWEAAAALMGVTIAQFPDQVGHA